MTGQAFTTRMPNGFVGQISRDPQFTDIETEFLSVTNTPTTFGVFVKTVSGQLQAIQANDAASVITGVLVRSYPSQSSGNAYGGPTPTGGELCNRMRKGYAMVLNAYGTPAKDGTVYVRNIATGGVRTGGAVGDIEALSDPGYNVVVTGATWTGVANANVCELRYGL